MVSRCPALLIFRIWRAGSEEAELRVDLDFPSGANLVWVIKRGTCVRQLPDPFFLPDYNSQLVLNLVAGLALLTR